MKSVKFDKIFEIFKPKYHYRIVHKYYKDYDEKYYTAEYQIKVFLFFKSSWTKIDNYAGFTLFTIKSDAEEILETFKENRIVKINKR